MATASGPDDLVDEFLSRNGHEERQTWETNYNKLQCPECGGLHGEGATECSVCGWAP